MYVPYNNTVNFLPQSYQDMVVEFLPNLYWKLS